MKVYDMTRNDANYLLYKSIIAFRNIDLAFFDQYNFLVIVAGRMPIGNS